MTNFVHFIHLYMNVTILETLTDHHCNNTPNGLIQLHTLVIIVVNQV